ncbi:MAG: hypothetical protein RTU92_01070 [Candidatus Thorarchaeota archaeon]
MIDLAPVDTREYDDGYTRTFRQQDIPKFHNWELDMLYEFVDAGKYGKAVIYLTSDRHRAIDDEMAEFVIRELMRRNL